MARYNIISIETKKPDWKVAVIQDMATQEIKERVSINRTDKNGVPFPNFDSLKVNDTVEGNFWASPSGSAALYPPRPQSASNSGIGTNKGGSGAISKAMDKKAENIEKFQDAKGEAIKLTTSMQLAVDCAIAEYSKPNSLDTLESLIIKYRKFILGNWEVDPTSTAPF